MNKSGDGARVAYPLFPGEDGGANPTSPLQFKIGIIELDLAIELNKLWHSRLPKVSRANLIRTKDNICFGALYDNRWFVSAIWTSPIARAFNGLNYLELRRMAISAEAPKNTASRMISIMVKFIRKAKPHIVKLISYQDTDVHSGTIYKASGWIEANRSHDPAGWPRPCRKRDKGQTTSDKIRWEKDLR